MATRTKVAKNVGSSFSDKTRQKDDQHKISECNNLFVVWQQHPTCGKFMFIHVSLSLSDVQCDKRAQPVKDWLTNGHPSFWKQWIQCICLENGFLKMLWSLFWHGRTDESKMPSVLLFWTWHCSNFNCDQHRSCHWSSLSTCEGKSHAWLTCIF